MGNSARSPDNWNQVASKVITQRQQVTIDELLEGIAKLKECVT